MKNLEQYIVTANNVTNGPINKAFDLVFDMIDQYTGPEKGHRAKVMTWKTSMEQGLSKESTIRNKLLILLGNVAHEQKVI